MTLFCEPTAGVVRMEALGHRAAQETGAGGQSCTGLQRPAAEGGRDVHSHVRRSHERSHNKPNAAQPRAGGCLRVRLVNIVSLHLRIISLCLPVSCRNRDISREWSGAVLCGGSSGRCVNHEESKRSKVNPQKRA